MINLAKNQGFEVIKTTPKGTVSMWEKRAAELLGIQKEAKKDKDVSGAGIGARVGAEYGAVTGGLAGAALGNVNANVLERTLPQLVHISPEMRQLYGVTPEIFESLSEESRFILDKGIRRKMLGAMALTGTAAGAAGGALPGAITGTVIKQNVPRDASGLKTTAVGAGTGFGTGAILPAILSKGRKPIPIAAGGAVGAVPGALIGHAISEAREKKASENYIGGNNMYRELLDIFKEAAGNVSAEELELFADEVLEEMVKEAGFLDLRRDYKESVGELDKEYYALEDQIKDRAKDRLNKFIAVHGRKPTRKELKSLEDEYMADFWNMIDNVAPNHEALKDRMVMEDPYFNRKNTALRFGTGLGTFGAITGGLVGATDAASKASNIAKGALKGTGVGAAVGLAAGALSGYQAGNYQDKAALKRLEGKTAFYSELLNGFEKVAAELSDEELETLSFEILDELTKEASYDQGEAFLDRLQRSYITDIQRRNGPINMVTSTIEGSSRGGDGNVTSHVSNVRERLSMDNLDDLLMRDRSLSRDFLAFVVARCNDAPELKAELQTFLTKSTITKEDLQNPLVKQLRNEYAIKVGLPFAGVGGLMGLLKSTPSKGIPGIVVPALIGAAIGGGGGAILGGLGGKAEAKDRIVVGRGGSLYPHIETEDIIKSYFDKSAFYSDLLNGFEKVAAELSNEELEVLSSNVLEELAKEAFFGLSVPIHYLDDDERYSVNVGIPNLVSVNRNFTDSSVRPNVGIGVLGPQLGLSFHSKKKDLASLTPEEMVELENNVVLVDAGLEDVSKEASYSYIDELLKIAKDDRPSAAASGAVGAVTSGILGAGAGATTSVALGYEDYKRKLTSLANQNYEAAAEKIEHAARVEADKVIDTLLDEGYRKESRVWSEFAPNGELNEEGVRKFNEISEKIITPKRDKALQTAFREQEKWITSNLRNIKNYKTPIGIGAAIGGTAGAALGVPTGIFISELKGVREQVGKLNTKEASYNYIDELLKIAKDDNEIGAWEGAKAGAKTGTILGGIGGALAGAAGGNYIIKGIPLSSKAVAKIIGGGAVGGGAVGAAGGGLAGGAFGVPVGYSLGKKQTRQDNSDLKSAFYSDLLNGFEKVAAELSDEELEVLSYELLDELTKEAGLKQWQRILQADFKSANPRLFKNNPDGRSGMISAMKHVDDNLAFSRRSRSRVTDPTETYVTPLRRGFTPEYEKLVANRDKVNYHFPSQRYEEQLPLEARLKEYKRLKGQNKPPAPAQAAPRPVNAQPINAQPINAQPINAQPVNAQPVNAQPVSALPVVVGRPAQGAAGPADPKKKYNKAALAAGIAGGGAVGYGGYRGIKAIQDDKEASYNYIDALLKIAKDDNEIGAWEGAKAGAKTGTILGGVGGALAGAGAGNYVIKGIPLSPKVIAKIIGGGALGVGTVGAVGGGVAGGAFGAPVGHVLGKKEQKRNNNLTVKAASEQSYLEKEAFPKIMNPKQFVESLRTGAKSTQQATDNAVNAAGAAAQKTTKTTKAETNKVKNKPEGNFIKRHPYVSTLAGVGVGAMIPGATSAVQQAGAAAVPASPPQPPQYYQQY